MGNVIFWAVFAAFVIIVVISGARKASEEKAEKLRYYIESFGEKDLSKDISFDRKVVGGMFSSLKENAGDGIFFIDDITWNDLSLDVIYESMK